MSIDFKTLHRSGVDNKFHATDIETDDDVVLEEMFPAEMWDCPEAFKMAGIRGYEPMTAKELETEEVQDERLRDPSYILEEKFDGTRALVYFLSQQVYNPETQSLDSEVGFCRVFSRRVSKKTNFYVENTDSLPQIREIDVPDLGGTVLDGEMFIDGLPFKEVSSTLNCLWDKAVDRQIEKGFISLHAFDILFYHGIDLRKMPLERRKEYLHLAVEEASSPYIEEVKYFDCGKNLPFDVYQEVMSRINAFDEDQYFDELEENAETYPNLYKCWKENTTLTPRAYYELIVSTGGEGLIVKPKSGLYLHKRGWEYSKIKKFLTRDLIVLGFDEPTKEYTGKDVKKWGFWVKKADDKKVQGNFFGDKNYIPVTKYYYYNQVGTMRLGVILTTEEFESIPKNKRGETYDVVDICPELDESQYNSDHLIMLVCDCSGYDDDTREYFTRNKDSLIGSVVEVKANELFRDSGKMRHPRFMRQRPDKESERCIWIDHIGSSEVTK